MEDFGGTQPIVVLHRPFQSRLGQGVVLAGGVTVQKRLFLEHRYGLGNSNSSIFNFVLLIVSLFASYRCPVNGLK